MQCRLSAFITRKPINMRYWQVFWLAPSSMPSHSQPRNSGFGVSRTYSELTAAVSAQDFHLIPFSLITSRREETSTKIKGKFTIFQEVHQIFAYKKATIVFYIQYIIKQKHLKSLFRTLEVHIIVSVVLFCKCCHDKVRKLTATQKRFVIYIYVYWTFKNV